MSENLGGLSLREEPRVRFDGAAHLSAEGWEDVSSYRTANLSRSGVLLRGEKPLVAEGPLKFRFDSGGATLQGEGAVAWLRRSRSAGVLGYVIGFSFLELSEESAASVERLVARGEGSREPLPTPAPPRAPSSKPASIETTGAAEESVRRPPDEAETSGKRSSAALLGGLGALVVVAGATWIFYSVGVPGSGRGLVEPSATASLPEDAAESEPRLPALAVVLSPAADRVSTAPEVERDATRVLSVDVLDQPTGTLVRVRGDGPFSENVISTLAFDGEAPRFLLRIADLAAPLEGTSLTLESLEAHGMRAGWHETETGGEVHLVFDLTSSEIVGSAEVVAGEILVHLRRRE